MADCHALLLKLVAAHGMDEFAHGVDDFAHGVDDFAHGVDEFALALQIAHLRDASGTNAARIAVHRALAVPEIYVYAEFARAVDLSEADRDRVERGVRALPALAHRTLSVDRLQRKFEPRAASYGASAPFHYVVEMDPAEGWRDELARWYDDEHMPGLAAVPGCVRAQRFVNLDAGPLSLACYDLMSPQTKESPAWLAVRHTAWSDRVRPQFRNTKRTMFRTLAGPAKQ